MSNEKKQEQKDEQPQAPNMRQVIIETDGNNIKLVKNETAGALELVALLQTIIGKISQR